MSANSTGETFLKRIRTLKKRFEGAVHSFEQDNGAAALESSKDILDETAALLEDIANDYRNALLKGKFSGFESERDFIQKNSGPGAPRIDSEKFLSFLTSLDRILSSTETEIKNNYPSPLHLKKILIKYRFKAAVGILFIGIVSIAIFMVNTARLRGKGLLGVYYDDTEFKEVFRRRVDHKIDFDWELGSPFLTWKKDDFSVRWTGSIKIPADGTYEFLTNSDDGVRLKIDGKTVLENWTIHRLATDRGSISLTAGLHPIQLEYFEKKRKAVIRLLWKSDGQEKASVVPPSVLVPADATE